MAGSSSASLADYRQALDDPESLHEFRLFLRRKLDMNRSSDTEVKRKFEQWLDFVLICQKVPINLQLLNSFKQNVYLLSTFIHS